jgi:hypothetical protein
MYIHLPNIINFMQSEMKQWQEFRQEVVTKCDYAEQVLITDLFCCASGFIALLHGPVTMVYNATSERRKSLRKWYHKSSGTIYFEAYLQGPDVLWILWVT